MSSSAANSSGFLSSLGFERTTVALVMGMAVIVFLILNVVGSDDPAPTTKTKPPTISRPGSDIGGLNRT